MGEAVLLRSPGAADVMAEQLSHLDKMSRRPNVTLRILPLELVHRGLECGASFTMLDFPADRRGQQGEPPFVYADNLTGAAYLDKPGELAAYSEVLETLVDAPSPAESRTIINGHRERCEQ